MAKPHITRTLGPIHFEDLDPHRFEDLVRQLAYDLKQWQSIEATGRGGADDGFDIRAYEVIQGSNALDDEDKEDENLRPMEGNLWMIQCKREKELGPKRIETIIHEAVESDDPPYGYILAAPVSFSKTAHDKFREELRSRGVMEFYLWGAGELEDMLHQPKNDHILFAFFGISLTRRQRARTTQIRATVSAKNKLRSILGDDPGHQTVLLRHLQDTYYPYEGDYKDFDEQPRWKQYSVVKFEPLGLVVSLSRHYAYLDRVKAEWDVTKVVNLVSPLDDDCHNSKKEELMNSVKGFWELLPQANQVMFVSNGLIRFDSMDYIDDKGDTKYSCPHIFVDFNNKLGPIWGRHEYLEINQYSGQSLDELKRVKVFLDKFPKPSFGTIYKDKSIFVNDRTRATLKYGQQKVSLYDADGRYGFLKPTDVVRVNDARDMDGKELLLKITNIRAVMGKELQRECEDNPAMKQDIEAQISRQFESIDTISVVEALVLYDWQIGQNRPVV